MRDIVVALSRGPEDANGRRDITLHFEGKRLRFTAGEFSRLVSCAYYATTATIDDAKNDATV